MVLRECFWIEIEIETIHGAGKIIRGTANASRSPRPSPAGRANAKPLRPRISLPPPQPRPILPDRVAPVLWALHVVEVTLPLAHVAAVDQYPPSLFQDPEGVEADGVAPLMLPSISVFHIQASMTFASAYSLRFHPSSSSPCPPPSLRHRMCRSPYRGAVTARGRGH